MLHVAVGAAFGVRVSSAPRSMLMLSSAAMMSISFVSPAGYYSNESATCTKVGIASSYNDLHANVTSLVRCVTERASESCTLPGMADSLKHRILLVDDDEQIRTGLEMLLADDWDVRIAGTGRDAIVAFADFSPDVVLIDVGLPDISGIDLLNHVKMYSE